MARMSCIFDNFNNNNNNWTTGKTAAFDISVTSPLNTHTLMEAGVSAGSAALATEGRKHRINDAKCKELGWLCVPLVAETYGAWGNEAVEAFSQLASRLATLQVSSSWRHLWQAQPSSSEGQCHCHPHQMYFALDISHVYDCTLVCYFINNRNTIKYTTNTSKSAILVINKSYKRMHTQINTKYYFNISTLQLVHYTYIHVELLMHYSEYLVLLCYYLQQNIHNIITNNW